MKKSDFRFQAMMVTASELIFGVISLVLLSAAVALLYASGLLPCCGGRERVHISSKGLLPR